MPAGARSPTYVDPAIRVIGSAVTATTAQDTDRASAAVGTSLRPPPRRPARCLPFQNLGGLCTGLNVDDENEDSLLAVELAVPVAVSLAAATSSLAAP